MEKVILAKNIASASGCIAPDMKISVKITLHDFGFEVGAMSVEGEPIKSWVRERILGDILAHLYTSFPELTPNGLS